ncbi:replication initiation protein [Roseateles sp. PN1]|uniref:replication initiation protein n=1 Tax=Roseateles sp. PN1 TaxID=3137372 RepID=UPI003139A026
MDSSLDQKAATTRKRKTSVTTIAPIQQDVLRKPVNTLAIVPRSARITPLGRKAYNVLLFDAQEQGLEKDVFRTPLDRIVKGVDFGSNDHDLIKKHLRAMVSTTVEWQSPTSGEGGAWNVSGLLAHAKLTKERGQVWVEWSYAVNLKQELLEPTVFAKLKLEVISQLRSHAGIALYEICTRYKDIGRTARQHWRWWYPVLSGQPVTEKTAKLEYRIFKRDTLKTAIAEVSAISDLEIELVEHKEGRYIADIQFLVRPKRQAALQLKVPPEPIDLSLVQKATELGIDSEKAEELLAEHGAKVFEPALGALQKRLASSFPAPLRDSYRYFKSLVTGSTVQPAAAEVEVKIETPEELTEARRVDRSKRQARWTEEWIRRGREKAVKAIAEMSTAEQDQLVTDLLHDMIVRSVHPSIRKRLQTSGWKHPMVVNEMVKYYAAGAFGDGWDKPTSEQLLEIAAEMGDA